jgi:protein-tyrosine phosphatase
MSDRESDRTAVLFVCLGNICRSPLAEAVFRAQVEAAGLTHSFEIDSAGTSAYHIGEPADARTARTAASRGVTLTSRARQVENSDFSRFDYILAMDADNYRVLERRSGRARPGRSELRMLREFDPQSDGDHDVPDPYYGGARGFEDVHDMVERACIGLLDHIREQRRLTAREDARPGSDDDAGPRS